MAQYATGNAAGVTSPDGSGFLQYLPSVFDFLGNYLGGSSQAKSAEEQRKQAQKMFELENQWRTDSSEYLKTVLPNFDYSMPNANQYFGPDAVNKQYDIARSNLNMGMNQAVSDASAQAGAIAGARGFANSGGFVNNAANQVRQSYFPQFGALEQGRASALNSQLASLYNALMGQTAMKNQFSQQNFNNMFDIQRHRLG